MVEGIFVKHRLIYGALALLALSAPAAAQGFEPGTLPPHEILTMLRSTGLDPLGQPVRRGPNYVLRAIDDNDREVRVVVSARSGGIVSVTPIATASRMPPPRGGGTEPYERMPEGYLPPGGPGSYGPLIVDEDDDALPPRGYGAPRPPGAVPGTPPRSSSAAPPPRGGATAPGNDGDASPPSGAPKVIMADPDRSGALPPPPERFPQRVAPPKPKPVTRAAAAPPKQAPLPKPKPAAQADAPPASAPQAAPSATAPAQAAEKSRPADDTPH